MATRSIVSQWRLVLAVVVCGAGSVGASCFLPESVLGFLLVQSFVLVMQVPFIRLIARAQARANLRRDADQLQAQVDDILRGVEELPPEIRAGYIERMAVSQAHIAAMRLVLADMEPKR